MRLKNKKGFIALFTVIIVSFVLLLIAITVNFSGFSGRFNIFDAENKERSAKLADACIEYVRLRFAMDPVFSGEDDLSIETQFGNEECHYNVIASDEVISSAETNNAFTFYWAKFNKNEPEIPVIDFEEWCNETSPCP